MINIAIIDQNETYRKSLKMVLEQVEGFHVVLESGEYSCLKGDDEITIQVLLINYSPGNRKCAEQISEASMNRNFLKSLILVMYKDELNLDFDEADVILKSSSKKEFEKRIRELVGS